MNTAARLAVRSFMLLVCVCLGAAADDQAAQTAMPEGSQPLTPQESLAAMHVTEGYRVELVAAEPLVRDPVAIAWGPDGRLWVVEMADYPLGIDDSGEVGRDRDAKPGGRIRYLEDTTGDGKYDRSTLFLEGIGFPTSITPWREGVIITAASGVIYAEDTDGDGMADTQKTLYAGFAELNTQLRVNGLRYGLDNWLYLANGLRTRGEIRSEITGETLTLGARDLRIRPDTGLMQPVSGDSQFGRVMDNHGNWFGVHNSFPVWHYVLEDFYLRRNPHVPAIDPKNTFNLPRNPPVYPRSTFVREYDHPHRGSLLTSACGLMIYRDALLFDAAADVRHSLTCDPQHNLVHRRVLREAGVSFTAERPDAEQHSEFLASEDRWFRPVNLRTGPDGAVWVVDMYRYLIEHPQFMPPEAQQAYRPHYRTGHDRGRIYRIVPRDAEPRPIPRLDQHTPRELVDLLDSPNGWHRDMVQQMLIWADDQRTVTPLTRMMREHANPLARLHAMCTLDGMDGLTGEAVQRALTDEHRAVRRHAVRLAADLADDHPPLVAAVAGLADDADAKVRLAAALTLAGWEQPTAGRALGRISVGDADDPYIRAAVMTGAPLHNAALVEAVTEAAADDQLSPLTSDLLTMALAQDDRDSTARLLRLVVGEDVERHTAEQFAVFADWLQTLAQRGRSIEQFKAAADDALTDVLRETDEIFEAARAVAADGEAALARRVAAVRLLGWDPPQHGSDYAQLSDLLNPRTPTQLQRAAMEALGRIGHDETPALLLERWARLLPAVRPAALDLLINRPAWAAALLEAVERGEVPLAAIDAVRRQRLTSHGDEQLREKARALLESANATDRQQVVASYRAAIELEGDADRGREVFANACAVCHRVDELGNDVGPNLLSVTDRTPSGLLTAILDPNQAIEPRYMTYQLTLEDGRVLVGIITAETATSVTLTTPDAESHTVLRSDIRELTSLNLSLMPDGLEAAIDEQAMADLIQFLRQPR